MSYTSVELEHYLMDPFSTSQGLAHDDYMSMQAHIIHLEGELRKAQEKLVNRTNRIKTLQHANLQRKLMLRKRIAGYEFFIKNLNIGGVK